MSQRDEADLVELREFAENFKFARKKIGLKQVEVGKKANIRQEFISLFEQANQNIGIDTMVALSHGIEIPLYNLLDPNFQTAYDFDLRLAAWPRYLKSLPECKHGVPERIIFGRNLKAARDALNWTQLKVQEITGIPDTKITLYESGNQGFEFFMGLRLARCLGKSLFILFK